MTDTISPRLVNWGRVVRDYPQFSHCYSIEYRHKSNYVYLTVAAAKWLFERGLCSETEVAEAYSVSQQARYEPPDRTDGETVERAWARVPNPSCKALLRLFYVKRRQPAYIAKRLKVDFDRELMIAQAAIAIELEKDAGLHVFPAGVHAFNAGIDLRPCHDQRVVLHGFAGA